MRILRTTFCFLLAVFVFLFVYSQNNRLTNERGQLLWQYNQTVVLDSEKPNTLVVHFVFINGNVHTAISLRQELYDCAIEWLETADIKVEKEDHVESLTAKLSPNQSIIVKYSVTVKPVNNALVLEKSALLIMNDSFEVRKEIIPDQHFIP